MHIYLYIYIHIFCNTPNNYSQIIRFPKTGFMTRSFVRCITNTCNHYLGTSEVHCKKVALSCFEVCKAMDKSSLHLMPLDVDIGVYNLGHCRHKRSVYLERMQSCSHQAREIEAVNTCYSTIALYDTTVRASGYTLWRQAISKGCRLKATQTEITANKIS